MTQGDQSGAARPGPADDARIVALALKADLVHLNQLTEVRDVAADRLLHAEFQGVD
jgi:ABC-type sulfate transport system substrate-binding protein